MEEHGLLHPWDEVARRDLRARTCDLLINRLELRGQQLSLATRQQERRVLGSTIAGPGAVVAGDRTVEVLEFEQVQGVLAEQESVDFVPAAAGVAELEVGPDAVRGVRRQSLAEVLEALAFVVELGGGHLDPAIVAHRPSLAFLRAGRTRTSYCSDVV